MQNLPDRDVRSDGSPLIEYSVCPKCHTADAALTTAALAAGGGWQCGRCQHHWTSERLATVAAYEAWSIARIAPR